MKLKKIHNYFLCKKYPFYKQYNAFSGEFCGYDSTWYDCIPYGWRKAFGKKLSKELRKQLKKDKALKSFRFLDIKEKYGTLRLYSNGCSEEVGDIIGKYELLSMCYCIYCGKPTKYITDGWIYYLCEDCAKGKNFSKISVEDIPCVYKYKDNKIYKCTTYGIDFFKHWNINPDDYIVNLKKALHEDVISMDEFTSQIIWIEKTVSDFNYIDLVYDYLQDAKKTKEKENERK